MRRIRTLEGMALGFVALALCAFAGQNYFGDADDGWAGEPNFAKSRAICRSVRNLSVPVVDRPTQSEAEALIGCSSEALFYGIRTKADPVKARKCAILEIERGEAYENPFAREGMLMTIYARGQGAKRNWNLATHMACAMWNAPVDSDNLVKSIQERIVFDPPDEPFDYCLDVVLGSSNASGVPCAAHKARIAAPLREARTERLLADLPPPAMKAYAKLLAAQAQFIALGQARESEPGAQNRAAPLYFEEALLDQHVAVLEALSKGEKATDSPARLAEADRELNKVFAVLTANLPASSSYGEINAPGVRESERAWIRYRDAWLDFAQIAWPRASLDDLSTRLTRHRASGLACILAYEGPDEDGVYSELCDRQ